MTGITRREKEKAASLQLAAGVEKSIGEPVSIHNYTTKQNPIPDCLAGAAFLLLATGYKASYEKGWNQRGATWIDALKHIEDGGNVGLLTGELSNGMIVLDCDIHWAETVTKLGGNANTLQITRDNKPDRGALVFRVTDGLPRSTSWKPDGTSPRLELLSRGKHKLIAGTYEGGCYRLINTQYGVREITLAELFQIWKKLTGIRLQTPVTRTKNVLASKLSDDGGLLDQLRAYWSAEAVFDHFEKATQAVKKGHDWKLKENGGLLVGNGSESWRWYCFADAVGGDAFDAWAYCTRGHIVDRSNKVEFIKVMHEMAEAAGLDFDTRNRPVRRIVTADNEILDADRLAMAGQTLLAARNTVGSRKKRTDQAAWMAVLDMMQSAGAANRPISARHLADKAGISAMTASRSLNRLVEAGLLTCIERQRGPLEAKEFALSDCIVGFDTQKLLLLPKECVSKPTIQTQMDTAESLLFDEKVEDAWRPSRHSRRDQKTGMSVPISMPAGKGLGSLGHSGRVLLSAMDAGGPGKLSALAIRSGMARSTVSNLAKYLCQLGLVEITRQGRAKVVTSVTGWRDKLEKIVPTMTTAGKSRKQRTKHAQERINRAESYLHITADNATQNDIDFAEQLIKRNEEFKQGLQNNLLHQTKPAPSQPISQSMAQIAVPTDDLGDVSSPAQWVNDTWDNAIVVDEFPSKYVQQDGEDKATFLIDRLFAYVPSKARVRAEISSEVIFDIPYS